MANLREAATTVKVDIPDLDKSFDNLSKTITNPMREIATSLDSKNFAAGFAAAITSPQFVNSFLGVFQGATANQAKSMDEIMKMTVETNRLLSSMERTLDQMMTFFNNQRRIDIENRREDLSRQAEMMRRQSTTDSTTQRGSGVGLLGSLSGLLSLGGAASANILSMLGGATTGAAFGGLARTALIGLIRFFPAIAAAATASYVGKEVYDWFVNKNEQIRDLAYQKVEEIQQKLADEGRVVLSEEETTSLGQAVQEAKRAQQTGQNSQEAQQIISQATEILSQSAAQGDQTDYTNIQRQIQNIITQSQQQNEFGVKQIEDIATLLSNVEDVDIMAVQNAISDLVGNQIDSLLIERLYQQNEERLNQFFENLNTPVGPQSSLTGNDLANIPVLGGNIVSTEGAFIIPGTGEIIPVNTDKQPTSFFGMSAPQPLIETRAEPLYEEPGFFEKIGNFFTPKPIGVETEEPRRRVVDSTDPFYAFADPVGNFGDVYSSTFRVPDEEVVNSVIRSLSSLDIARPPESTVLDFLKNRERELEAATTRATTLLQDEAQIARDEVAALGPFGIKTYPQNDDFLYRSMFGDRPLPEIRVNDLYDTGVTSIPSSVIDRLISSRTRLPQLLHDESEMSRGEQGGNVQWREKEPWYHSDFRSSFNNYSDRMIEMTENIDKNIQALVPEPTGTGNPVIIQDNRTTNVAPGQNRGTSSAGGNSPVRTAPSGIQASIDATMGIGGFTYSGQ